MFPVWHKDHKILKRGNSLHRYLRASLHVLLSLPWRNERNLLTLLDQRTSFSVAWKNGLSCDFVPSLAASWYIRGRHLRDCIFISPSWKYNRSTKICEKSSLRETLCPSQKQMLNPADGRQVSDGNVTSSGSQCISFRWKQEFEEVCQVSFTNEPHLCVRESWYKWPPVLLSFHPSCKHKSTANEKKKRREVFATKGCSHTVRKKKWKVS